VLPPNVAGYAPYCPYTAQGPATRWSKPDIVRARQLIEASGTRGARVTVLKMTDTPSAAASDYLVAVLDRLGYRAHTVELPLARAVPLSYRAAALAGHKRVDAGPWLLGAPYPSAAYYFLDALYCSADANAGQDNFAHFCDKRLNMAIDRARSLEVGDPTAAIAAWKQADRIATDDAPWVFSATTGQFDFVSERVGNYQNQPEDEALLDQLWVR
jgi:peptide/nickel transport system substrate-binding protein